MSAPSAPRSTPAAGALAGPNPASVAPASVAPASVEPASVEPAAFDPAAVEPAASLAEADSRRLRDAAIALPALGALLLAPALLHGFSDALGRWLQPDPTSGIPLAAGLSAPPQALYVFGVWIALILGAGLLAGPLRRRAASDPPDDRSDHGATGQGTTRPGATRPSAAGSGATGP